MNVSLVDIVSNLFKLKIGVVYRPPSTPTEVSLELFKNLTLVAKDAPCLLLLGDFNLPCINWQTLESSSRVGQTFLLFCSKHNLTQFVKEPTNDKHILDLLLVTITDLVLEVSNLLPLSNSDHCTVFAELNISTEQVRNKTCKPAYSEADYELINLYLQLLN